MIPDYNEHGDSVRQFADYFKLKSQRPGEAFLSAILAHFSRIPYENISKIIKWHEHFDDKNQFRMPEEVMADHARWQLGGTCFSLTFFLQTLLCHNGFKCYPVTADMRAGQNIHSALIVSMQQKKYLVDPGYLLNRPMLMDPQQPRMYRTEHTGIELQFDSATRRFHLFTFDRHGSKWRYSFMDVPVTPKKFLHHWQESFHRNSMHGISLTKIQQDGLIYIHKNFMRKTNPAGKENFNIRQNYHETIHSVFGIKPEIVEQALYALDNNLRRERELGLFVKEKARI